MAPFSKTSRSRLRLGRSAPYFSGRRYSRKPRRPQGPRVKKVLTPGQGAFRAPRRGRFAVDQLADVVVVFLLLFEERIVRRVVVAPRRRCRRPPARRPSPRPPRPRRATRFRPRRRWRVRSPLPPALAAGRARAAAAPWKIVPHFGQMIGSLLRSKNFAPQFWHWRLVPSSGFATAINSRGSRAVFRTAPLVAAPGVSMRFASMVDRLNRR